MTAPKLCLSFGVFSISVRVKVGLAVSIPGDIFPRFAEQIQVIQKSW